MSDSTAGIRALAFVFPDWPVTAARLLAPDTSPPHSAVAVLHANIVVAASAVAQQEGVRVGLKRREAQSRCPSIQMLQHDPDRDARAFLPVVRAIEEAVPGVQIVKPGVCVLRARGAARYYGSEVAALEVLLQHLQRLPLERVCASAADGPFAAMQAARFGPQQITIIDPGQSAQFLAPLPTECLDNPDLASMLARLGIHTLGQFAALDAQRVHDRLSDTGLRLHTLASGKDPSAITPTPPPADTALEKEFDQPLELADQIAFALRQDAASFLSRLHRLNLVCTEVRIELFDEHGGHNERVWLHPSCFDDAELVNRVRWQLQSVWEHESSTLRGGVGKVIFTPVAVDAASAHQPGLFGQGGDARLHHALSRVQGMLGHDSVLIPAFAGGRHLADRQMLVPWGERPLPPRDPVAPWPGHLPAPLPATVFSNQPALAVLDVEGRTVAVTERGQLSADPKYVATPSGDRSEITAWAGPWPLHERSWDRLHARHVHRLQVVTSDEIAWLLNVDAEGWRAEGRYD